VPLRVDIPLSEGAPLPFFDMQAPLDGVTYTLQFRWNVRASSWYMDVLDEQSETVFLAGLRLCSDWPLAAYITGRSPPGGFVVVDSTGQGADPDVASLGVRHRLLYFTAAELAGG
jgi:hypothetical protein